MSPILSAKDVHARLGGTDVLRGVSFDLEAGRVLAIMGSSGSGKTTLLRCINGLCPIDSGTIRVQEHVLDAHTALSDSRPLRENVGMVFQQFNLWPHRTVLQNIVEAPVLLTGISNDEAERRAIELLRSVSMDAYVDRYPSELSGGQQQRVAIARALAMRPAVLLLDEITSALDTELKREVSDVIRMLSTKDGLTMIIVTHDLSLVESIADDVLFLENGRIVTPSSFPSTPASGSFSSSPEFPPLLRA